MRYSEWFAHWWADQRIRLRRHVRYDHPAVMVWLTVPEAQSLVDRLYPLTGRPENFKPVVRFNKDLTGRVRAYARKTYPPRIELRERATVRTICHEMAHCIDFYDGGEIEITHGPPWQQWYDRLLDLVVGEA